MTLRSLAILSLLAVPACMSKGIVETVTIAVPQSWPKSLGAQKVGDSIKKALQNRGWILESEASGHMDAKMESTGRYMAKIAIDYDERQIAIRYAGSEGLDYEKHADGRVTIHRRFNHWMSILHDDITRNLSFAN